MVATILKMGELQVPNPDYGDMKLNLFPVEAKGKIKLPKAFEPWNDVVNIIFSMVPLEVGTSNKHYVTIDSKFFTETERLRAEGIHIDGNFCADPNFKHKTWGGTQTTWGGSRMEDLVITTPWMSPYGVKIPVGEYVSSKKGGLLCVSSEVGCQAWSGEFHGSILDNGDFSEMIDQLKEENRIVLDKNGLYFMSSNTPHETMLNEQGVRRTLVRVTLAHDYSNKLILN